MGRTSRGPAAAVLGFMGSLKLTVTLLGMSIFLVFAGTLAQRFSGIWTVVDQYFRCWIARIDMKVFYLEGAGVGGWFPFPGGWLIGGVMLANLLVAHASRIRLEARGRRLAMGAAVLAAGIALTWIVISHVFDADSSEKKVGPTWRVTLQLIQAGGAALVLFMGCRMLFGRKAGIVLLHSGVVLLMIGELITGVFAQEGMMTVFEGQTVNFSEDTRSVELAVIDPSDPAADDVVTVPESLLRQGKVVSSIDLPFDIEVPTGRFMKNAGFRRPKEGESNPATAGVGLLRLAAERSEESGVSTSGAVDLSAAYVDLKDKSTGASLGTRLVAVDLARSGQPERVTVGGKTYDVYLRFKRTYKPYALYLYDFQHKLYKGTSVPKDFSSFVRLIDDERGDGRDVRIWMNNPLRYRGDTLYQASWDRETEAGTVLQVVDNESWMIPYVACMIVAAGMLGQFGLHLLGFLRKRRVA